MEFGKLPRVEEVDFSLPPDDPMTTALLQTLSSNKEALLKVYVGCTQWGNKNWLGKVYPKGTKEKDFLALYLKQFNCIELNALFYHLQPRSVIERWASLADKEFRFCPKFLNTISHTLQLQHAQRDTDLFIEHMQSFGDKLGYSFLQLSDKFGPDRAGLLQEYARLLPRDFNTCIELRQESWFTAAAAAGRNSTAAGLTNDITGITGRSEGRHSLLPAVDDTWSLFRELGIGTVITDTAGRRDCVHMKLTAPVAFIRYVGNNLHPTDFPRIDAWVDRIKTWIDKGLKEIYFIIHSPDELYAPELAAHAIEQFNQKCGTGLKPPKLLKGEASTNLSLF